MRILARTTLLALLWLATNLPGAAQERPMRVISLNLCTDLHTLLLADPDQITSLSFIAADATISPLAEEATAFDLNQGLAEEVFVQTPDLVLAGAYTNPTLIGLLRGLGLRVEQLPTASTFDDIRRNTITMGEWLGQSQRAAQRVAQFDAILSSVPLPDVRPSALLIYPNAYTSGTGTLADALLQSAGFTNRAAELGLVGLTHIPLELVVTATPDIILWSEGYAAPAMAQDVARHPALRAIAPNMALTDTRSACGTTLLASAVADLADARLIWNAGR